MNRLIFPLLALSLFAGCNSDGTAGLASLPGPSGSNVGPNTIDNGGSSNNDSGSNVQVGDSCTGGDSSKICLALHFVSYQDSSGTPTASTSQAATIIRTMDQIWSQCDIGFQIEKFETVDPTQYGLAYGAQSQNQTDQIRQIFKDPSNELLAVTTGPWGTAVNAWTNMPGDGIYGAIMEASIVGYGGGIIYAHEFGHYLGLDHVADPSNLMDAIIYTNSAGLTSGQCQTARQTASSDWSAMIRL